MRIISLKIKTVIALVIFSTLILIHALQEFSILSPDTLLISIESFIKGEVIQVLLHVFTYKGAVSFIEDIIVLVLVLTLFYFKETVSKILIVFLCSIVVSSFSPILYYMIYKIYVEVGGTSSVIYGLVGYLGKLMHVKVKFIFYTTAYTLVATEYSTWTLLGVDYIGHVLSLTTGLIIGNVLIPNFRKSRRLH